MGKGRAPCCAKVGLNRGAWTPEEDLRLITHIRQHGHSNWRALPKLAGLLRCGKSCRLRWINYLRPDLKRGNFTRDEEETIIRLHGLLGNKWSKIAACLPGRTDNEIKNVWHTHLKKRLKGNGNSGEGQSSSSGGFSSESDRSNQTKADIEVTVNTEDKCIAASGEAMSRCSSSLSCSNIGEAAKGDSQNDAVDDILVTVADEAIDEELWSLIEWGDAGEPECAGAGEEGQGGVCSWLEELEKQLIGDGVEKMDPWDAGEVDPVTEYFRDIPSPPPPAMAIEVDDFEIIF